MQACNLGRVVAAMLATVMAGQASLALGATVAYWRFETGPLDANVDRGGQLDGVFYPGVPDESGNGNALSAWSDGGYAGYAYRNNVSSATVPQTGAANNLCVQNTGDAPGMFTATGAPIQTITPAAFTIEATIMPENGGYRAIVGRDSQGAATIDQALAALYLQLVPGDGVAIKFADVSGYWHEAVSAPGTIKGFAFPDVASGHWYHLAAVSDGSTLSLYVDDVDNGTGYQLVAQTDMTLSGSPDTALTAGTGDGADWDAGNWSIGRGLHNGNHVDRGYGFIDEVRISDSALDPSEFLFTPPHVALWPAQIDATPVDPPATITVVTPVSCHAGQPVDVTVTSDNAATAKPVGGAGSAEVHFAAGSGGTQPLNIEFGTPGVANFTVSATGGCPTAPTAPLTVAVHAFDSVSLQAAYDIMLVGQTQQANVTAVFGPLTRNVSAASFGTTYAVNPAGIVNIDADGLITAVGTGTAVITATFNGVTTPQLVIATMPAGHTVAYWRFEEGPADAFVPHPITPNGAFYPSVPDVSGNGNDLSAWATGGAAGYAYRTNRPATSIPELGGAANNFSVQNTGTVPGMFTQTGSGVSTMTPAAFTIEASFMPDERNAYRTVVGRDSQGAATVNAALAALYLQVYPDESVAIKFADVSGYWHEAVSSPGAVVGYVAPNTASGHWYDFAAVSDGSTLSLYINDVSAGTGYQLAAHTDMTLSGSPNTALTAGTGDGGDWDAGNWSVGRGLYNGGHGDRAIGFIDEVRISDVALDPSQFLFSPDYMVLWPNAVQMAAVDAPIVSLVIPTSCNESQAVDVTVTSDAPSIARPAGSNGTAVFHFAAGGSRLFPITIESDGPGEAHFSLSATGGCPADPGTALTVTVHTAQSVDLEATYDLMQIGQSQQATVQANFGPAGARDITAGSSTGTTYQVEPSGVVEVNADGMITAVGLGTATITATYNGMMSSGYEIAVITPYPARPKVAGSGILLVDLKATDATVGQSVWINQGSLGDFTAVGQPALGVVAGETAVTFDGTTAYQGPLAPTELLGGQGRTIEVWAYNPSIDCSQCLETMVAWGHRGGPCGSNLAFGFGDHPTWGAVGGWCDNGDLGWNNEGGSPPLGEWRYLVYTYDPNIEGGLTLLFDNAVQANSEYSGAMPTNPGHINLAVQNNSANAMDFPAAEWGVLSLAAVRVHDGALTLEQITANFRAGIDGRGIIRPDSNLDGMVDSTDFAAFNLCVSGPSVPVSGACTYEDFDADGDCDQDDFAIFQRCYSGPQPATLGCEQLDAPQ